MNDSYKSNEQLLAELQALRDHVTQLEARLEDERKYRKYLEKTSDMMFVVDAHGILQEFIPGTDIKPLAPADTFLGNTANHLLPPEVAEANQKSIVKCLETGEKQTLEYQLPTGDSLGYYEARFFKVAENLVFALVRDITEHKQLETHLQFQNQILEHISHGIYSFRSSDGEIIQANRRWLEMFGYEEHEVIGQNARVATILNKDRDDIIQSIQEQKNWEGEILNARKDGTQFWSYAKVSKIHHTQHGEIWVSVREDITERKKISEDLESERNLLRAILENTPISIYVKNTAGQFILSNIAHQRFIGLAREEFIGKTVADIAPEALAKAVQQADADVMERGTAFIDREQYVGIYGREQWVLTSKVPLYDSRGNITGLVGISRDITDAKLAQQKLQDERNLLLTVINHLPADIFVKDRESRFELVNSFTMRGLGVSSPEEYIGKTDYDFHDHALAGIYRAEEKHIIETGEPLLDHEQMVFDASGRQHWNLNSKVPIRDSTGTITGIVGIGIDLTDRKQAEATFLENEKLRMELEKEQELAELQVNFMTMISHEIRTPLASILLSCDILEKYWDQLADERKHDKIRLIMAQGHTLEEIMTDFSVGMQAKRGYLEYRPIHTDLIDLCHQCIDLFASDSEEHIGIRFNYTGHLDSVWLDPKLMNRVISNLLSNAIKYSPQGGAVELELVGTDDELVIRCRDHGIGIPEQDQARLFTTFFRANNVASIRGTGLGLSIVKSIIDLHGGTITCDSVVDEGTTFTIHIPTRP